MEGVGSQDNFIDLRLFFLRHDAQHGVLIQFPGLTEFFHPLGLGQRWSSLFTLNGLHQKFLFLWLQIGNFHSGGHGDFLIVHHLLKLGGQIIETNIPLNLGPAFASFFCNDLNALFPVRLVPNLGTS